MAKQPRNDHDARMSQLVMTLGGMGPDPLQGFPPKVLAQLDRTQIGAWVSELRSAETGIRKLRSTLEALAEESPRLCDVCAQPIAGRADIKYCGAACRQRRRRNAIGTLKPQDIRRRRAAIE